MKKMLEIIVDSGFKKLDSSKLSKIMGGNGGAASGNTRTASGDKCDGTAVCNCNCPRPETPQPIN